MIKLNLKVFVSICIFSIFFVTFSMENSKKILQMRSKRLPLRYSFVAYQQYRYSNKTLELFKKDYPLHNIIIEKEEDIPASLLHESFDTNQQDPVIVDTQKLGTSIFTSIKNFFVPPKPTISLSSYACSGKEIKVSDMFFLKQLSVANQFGNNGGGNASCGYQSLKNAIFLIKALQDIKTIEDLSTTLNDLNLIQQLFGPINTTSIGKWRAIIMQQRAYLMFKNFIVQNLPLKKNDAIIENNGIMIKDVDKKYLFNKNKIREIYSSILGNFGRDAATALTEGKTTSLYVAPNLFIEYIQSQLQLETIVNPTDFFDKEAVPHEEKNVFEAEDSTFARAIIYHYLHNKDTIINYFAISSLEPFELTLEDTKKAFDFYNKNNRTSIGMDGDWLQEEEIYQLKKIETQPSAHFITEDRTGLLHDCNFKLTIIEDMHDLDGSFTDNIRCNIFREIPLKSQRGINKAKEALSSPDVKTYIHAFIISTAEREGASHGHWFVVLLYKHENCHEYIVMDSAYNTNRLYDERVKKIISLLEGQETTFVASDEELKKLEKIISSMIDKRDITVVEEIEHYQSCGGKKDFSKEVALLFQS